MWSQIVGTLVLLVVATYVIQLFAPRARTQQSRTSVQWDVAPVIGFFGAVLLALSLAEAFRRAVIDGWAWGIALGLILGIVFWVGSGYRISAPIQKKGSALRATFRLARTFGMPALAASIGVYLAVRIFGSRVEVFVAGAFGILMMAIALRIFVAASNRKTIEDNDG